MATHNITVIGNLYNAKNSFNGSAILNTPHGFNSWGDLTALVVRYVTFVAEVTGAGDLEATAIYEGICQGIFTGAGDLEGDAITPGRIDYELIIGPVTFGASHIEKRVRKVILVVTKTAVTTMYVSTSVSDTGVFTAETEVAAGVDLDMQEISLPLAQGDPSGGLAYRVKIRGTGRVQVHEVVFNVSGRRR